MVISMLVNQLEFIFFFDHKADSDILYHHHQCYEMVYYVKGKGTTNIGGVEYSYSDNTFSLIRPNSYHNEAHFEETEVFCVGFSLGESNFITINDGVYRDHSSILLQNVSKMQYEMLNQQLHYNVKLELLLSEFLIEFDRTRSAQTPIDSFHYIENYIHENFNHDINLPALAKVSGYSYDHFRHMFKRRTGLSPLAYIFDKRITYAKRLIQSTDMTMSMISQECGFSTSSQFSSMFKKITGLSPRQFQQNCHL